MANARKFIGFALLAAIGLNSCGGTNPSDVPLDSASAVFLHHSTGGCIWDGGVSEAIEERNADLGTDYTVVERSYPDDPWDWQNYPADYYNLWVERDPGLDDDDPDIAPLEVLCESYGLIIWKHCYPVTDIGPDSGSPDPASDTKTLANYMAAYGALKEKMLSFPNNRFIVWTGAVELEANCEADQAARLKEFRDWVIDTWDEEGDNIFVFDFWYLETEGGNYLLPEHAGDGDHPDSEFSAEVAPKFAERIADVLQGRGDDDPLTGF